MDVQRFDIEGVIVLTPRRYEDSRGHFSETFNVGRFASAGVNLAFVQDNQSLSRLPGTIRGLHCQIAPHPQGKLVRVVRGSIWDVAVDTRLGSPTYGRHVGVTLSAGNGAQMWIPPGFLHGFCTLEPDTEVFYKVSGQYDAASERGVRWDDPTLALPWPVASKDVMLSDKDRVLPRFDEIGCWFPN